MSASSAYVYDESQSPIVRIVVPSPPASDSEFERLLAWHRTELERRRPFAVVFELATGAGVSVERRERIRRHTRQHEAAFREYQCALGVVVGSAYQRALASAVLWIAKPPSPARIFLERESALDWARSRMAAPRPLDALGATLGPEAERASRGMR
jgi:hypothetical protein